MSLTPPPDVCVNEPFTPPSRARLWQNWGGFKLSFSSIASNVKMGIDRRAAPASIGSEYSRDMPQIVPGDGEIKNQQGYRICWEILLRPSYPTPYRFRPPEIRSIIIIKKQRA